MLIEEIHQFIVDVEKHSRPAIDDQLLVRLKSHFSEKNAKAELADDDKILLKSCFVDRWQKICDKSFDFTLSSKDVNQYWISLAKRLSDSHISILIPTVENIEDYTLLKPISKIKEPTHLLVSFDGKTVITKKGLVAHLDTVGKLSARATRYKNDLRHMTVLELWRLRSCQDPDPSIVVDKDRYNSIWDYLRKKIFTRLQAEGELPKHLIPQLKALVDKYDTLKNEDGDFAVFKLAFQDFLKQLYHCKLENINQLYGVPLNPSEDYYLLDLFIDIHEADSFCLDDKMKYLKNWLGYKRAAVSNDSTRQGTFFGSPLNKSPQKIVQTSFTSMFHCLTSLLAVQFSLLPLSGTVISIWDQSNTVFSEAIPFFNSLYDLIEQDKLAEAQAYYTESLPAFLKNRANCTSILDIFNYSGTAIIKWYENLEKGTLSELSVYWYEPAVIFKAGIQFQAKSASIEKELTELLHEILHTCAQPKNQILKKLRINILFSKFVQKLPAEEKSNYLNFIANLHEPTTTEEFLLDAYCYVGKNLVLRAPQTEIFKAFETVSVRELKLDSSVNEKGVIQYFIDFINEHRSEINSDVRKVLIDYLGDLKISILTEKKRADAPADTRNPTYTGAF